MRNTKRWLWLALLLGGILTASTAWAGIGTSPAPAGGYAEAEVYQQACSVTSPGLRSSHLPGLASLLLGAAVLPLRRRRR